MSAPLIRVGRPEDIGAVMTVMEVAFHPDFGEAWTRGQCLAVLSLADTWLVMAETRAGVVVGFALARAIAGEAELLLLAVHPERRRAGIGGLLLGAIVAAARERHAAVVHLEMRDGNAAADFYARAGFRVVGRRPKYYRGGDGRLRDALTLSRRLDHEKDAPGTVN